MPELPEVETIKRQLHRELKGRVISEVWYDRAKLLRPSPSVFIKGVMGKKIGGVRRRAKLLVFVLREGGVKGIKGVKEDGGCILCHLKLSGRLLVRREIEEPDEYVHIILSFEGGGELRFAEARLFGYMEYLADKESLQNVLAKFGPEFFDLDRETFLSLLSTTRRAVKVALLDQKLVAGIGNIYANDALYLSKVHPVAAANSLSASQSDSLFRSLQKVLGEGLKYGGASDQWYRQIHGEKGSYQNHFKVYGRAGERCGRCGGKIERIEVGGRGTFFCPGCQK